MSQISQDIRSGSRNTLDYNNPGQLYTEVKPSRIIITDGVPEQTDGELVWYAIDQNTGVLYYKSEESGGQWQGIYQFSGGGACGITDGSNVGIGNDIFRQKVGSVLEFKTIVSQPQTAFESVLNINDNPANTEVNITGQSCVSDVINYGFNSDQWIIDSANTTTDTNGNRQLYIKHLSGGQGINVTTQSAGSDKYLEITNTGILNVVNADTGPGLVNSSVNGISSIKNLTAGAGISLSFNPNNIQISTTTADDQHYFYSYQLALSYNVLSTFQNLPPFVAPLFSNDFVAFPNINGSSFIQYVGAPDVVYSFSYDISASSTLQALTPFNFIFRIAEGNPLVSQVAVPVSGTLLHFPAQTPNNTTSFNTTSTTFLFKPTPNQYYTLQAQCTINNLVLSVQEIKINLQKV